MNVGWGGVQPSMKQSKILNENYLGPAPDRFLNVGDTQHMNFTEDCLGPFDDKTPHLTREDRPYTPDELLMKSKRSDPNIRKGWLNKPKGLKQILWERGLWKHSLQKNQMQLILASLPDFQQEKIGIQNLLESRGHILIVSPKCHPELAGSGIEYAWGIAEINFKNIQQKCSQNVKRHVEDVLSPEKLPLSSIWKYERKSRDYIRLYHKSSQINEDNLLKYSDIEKLRQVEKIRRSHRSIFDIERDYLYHGGSNNIGA
jgi:hypothetical protein